MTRSPDVLVVGGGVIGCAVAHQAAKLGLSVTLLDQPKRGRATSAAAGALWPSGELAPGSVEAGAGSAASCLRRFAVQSARAFPDLAREIRARSGVDVELRRGTVLFLAYDEHDEPHLSGVRQQAEAVGADVEWLSPEQLAREAPCVTRQLRGALRVEGVAQVNAYKLADGMKAVARALGVRVVAGCEVTSLIADSGRVTGVLTPDGERHRAGVVVNAAGVWARALAASVGLDLPVFPVRGQMLCTEVPSRPLEGSISTAGCFVSRAGHGEVLIGSTSERVGFDVDVTSDAMCSLSAAAVRAVPTLGSVRVRRAWSGLRPGSPDELPILGPVPELPGYLNACGHFRTGVVGAPLTGLLVAQMAAGLPLSFPLEPLSIQRLAHRSGTLARFAPGWGEAERESATG